MMATSRVSKITSTYEPYQKNLDRRLSEPKKGFKAPPIKDYFQKGFDVSNMTKVRDRSYCY